MDMKKIFASFLICGALSLGSVPAHAGFLDDITCGVSTIIDGVVGGLFGGGSGKCIEVTP